METKKKKEFMQMSGVNNIWREREKFHFVQQKCRNRIEFHAQNKSQTIGRFSFRGRACVEVGVTKAHLQQQQQQQESLPMQVLYKKVYKFVQYQRTSSIGWMGFGHEATLKLNCELGTVSGGGVVSVVFVVMMGDEVEEDMADEPPESSSEEALELCGVNMTELLLI